MRTFPILLALIFIISTIKSLNIKEREDLEDSYNFLYPVYIGPDEEERQFLIDPTRQITYLFRNDKLTSSIEDEEFETNLEINTLNLKDFEFHLSSNFFKDNHNIDGIIGLGTVNGKNSFMIIKNLI